MKYPPQYISAYYIKGITTQEMDSIVQVITTTPQGMAAGTAWFSKDARLHAEKHLNATIDVTVNGQNITAAVVPKHSKYLFTNLHVVNGATTVSIRIPALHRRDIPVDVIGYSDLDIACLRLSGEHLKCIEDRIGPIPELEMIDSDAVMPTHNSVKPVYIRAYPCGEDDGQFFSTGVVSGTKHAMGQEYLITDIAQFNEGVSGGALLHEGKVVGMNVMKLVKTGVSGMNLHIPSNRIKTLLPYLVDNTINDLKRKTQEIAMTSMQNAQTLGVDAHLFAHIGAPVDMNLVRKAWKKHSLGGFKSHNGQYKPVSFKEWYQTHIHDTVGGHALFKAVIQHIQHGRIKQVKQMRRFGYENYKCKQCTAETPCNMGSHIELQAEPRIIHMPNYHINYSNTDKSARDFYETDKTGVIIVSSSPKGPALKHVDYLHAITADGIKYNIDEYGEWYNKETKTSITVKDIITRTKLGTDMTFHVLRDKQDKDIHIKYDLLKDDERPEIRVTSEDKVIKFQGVLIKQLRAEETKAFGLHEYFNPMKLYEKKFVIVQLDPRSQKFHNYNLQPGQIIEHINGQEIQSVEHLCEQLKQPFVVLRTKDTVAIFSNETRE